MQSYTVKVYAGPNRKLNAQTRMAKEERPPTRRRGAGCRGRPAGKRHACNRLAVARDISWRLAAAFGGGSRRRLAVACGGSRRCLAVACGSSRRLVASGGGVWRWRLAAARGIWRRRLAVVCGGVWRWLAASRGVWRWRLAARGGVWRWLVAARGGVWRWLAGASGFGEARIPVVKIGDDLRRLHSVSFF